MKEKYDKIGVGYNQTRKPDPYLLSRFAYHLQLKKDRFYIDVGCGTGNYTIELQKKGGNWMGIDPSKRMLEAARARTTEIEWKIGKAENMPLKNEIVDGVLASLTIHHWTDLKLAFKEIYRILKPEGKIVLFTSTPRQMKGYWLNHYFPKMLFDSMKQMPAYEVVAEKLENGGFEIKKVEKYFVQKDLQDLFLYAGKNRPALYLDEQVRSGISSFSSLAKIKEVENGLNALEKDLASGKIEEVIEDYQNEEGDYLFVAGQKLNWRLT